jgi:hypothetical protein
VDHIQQLWKNISEMLEKVPHTWREWTMESLYERAMNGNIQVWGIGPPHGHKAFMFTQLARFPAMRILEVIWFCGEGALEDGLDILDAVGTRFAQIQECDRIDIMGRQGWKPFAEAHGFKLSRVVYSRDVPKERIQ